MIYCVSVSGGAGSTIALHRTVEKHGPESVVAVFADTNTEHHSLYASLHHLKTVDLPGVEFVWLTNDGMDIWDVFNKYNYIKKGGTGCKASLELKKKPLDTYMLKRFGVGGCIKVSGLDHTEQDRIERFDRVHKLLGFDTWHPLNEPPFISPCEQVEMLKGWGYPDQKMYEKGYPHNNCGGGCVLAGISQWVGLYHDFQDTFMYHMEKEAEFFKRTGYCILRNRRGGETKPLLLSELVDRIKNDDLAGLQEFRSTCGCMTPNDE